MEELINISAQLVLGFEEEGIRDAFIVTGGAIAGFTEALARSKKIQTHYMLTEQSAAIAAESYGHYDGKPALLVVTSGPGVTNALTGIAAAWTNSTPMIVISGQARSADVKISRIKFNRQWGNQHLNTIQLVSSITKLAIEPVDPFNAFKTAQELIGVATEPRQGPTWISIPSDIQRANADLSRELINLHELHQNAQQDLTSILDEVLSSMQSSKKPLVLLGNGARIASDQLEILENIAERFGLALLTTWTGLDLISKDAPTYFGRPGTIATARVANLAVQECDFLLVLGARLDLAQVGFRPADFASQAEVFRVDIDASEFDRIPKPNNWKEYLCDAGSLLRSLIMSLDQLSSSPRTEWIKRLRELESLPLGRNSQELADGISTYQAVAEIDSREPANVVLGSSGTCVEMVLQSWRVAKGQRFLNSGGLGSMGFAVAGGIGVAAKTHGQVVVIESDGSLSMNIQDLETVARSKLPIKIAILDSNGYKSIKLSQRRQGQSEHGSSVETGVYLPDAIKWAQAAGIETMDVADIKELANSINWLYENSKPRLVRIRVSETEEAFPRLLSKPNSNGIMETAPFGDLWPDLSQ
jgi:acetolactate synthase I/II/III large subunit